MATTKKKSTTKRSSSSKRKSTAAAKTPLTSKQKELQLELIHWGIVLGLLILTLGIYLSDSMGIIGIGVNGLFVGLFGFSAYVITIYSFVIACIGLFGKLTRKLWGKLWFGYAFMLVISSLLHVINGKALITVSLMFKEATAKTGGLIGGLVGGGLEKLVGHTGAIILLVFALILLVVALTERSLVNGLRIAGIKTKQGTQKVAAYADEKVAEAKLRAEERAAYKEENLLTESESGQIALAEDQTGETKPKRMSSFFHPQKFSSVKTDDAARAQAQEAAKNAQLTGTLSDIATEKGVAASNPTVAEVGNTDFAGVDRMISGAKAVMPDVTLERPADLDREYVPDPSILARREAERNFPSFTIPNPERFANKGTTATVPAAQSTQNMRTGYQAPEQGVQQSAQQPVQAAQQTPNPQAMPNVPQQHIPAQRPAPVRRNQAPVLDIPLIADDVYLEKKRRYQERMNQLAQQMAAQGMINEENIVRSSNVSAVSTPVAPVVPMPEVVPAAPVSTPEPISFQSRRDEAPVRVQTQTVVQPKVQTVEPAVVAEPIKEVVTDIDLMDSADEDDGWGELLNVADEAAKSQDDINVSTEAMFEREAFPTGYEDRNETAQRIQNTASSQSADSVKKPGPTGKYIFPPIDLLSKPKNTMAFGDDGESLEESAAKLKKVLNDFGVDIEDEVQANRGPAVTRFELKPKTGVKVSRIVGLTDDIAMNLAAQSIRIEAPIPGKSAVGIEVPNQEIRTVTLREVLESDEFTRASSKVTFSLGRDIDNICRVADVAKMPHLLIAGSTGSGKSVCINSLIVSLLYKADPNDVKLILIDPKVVELSVYNGIPHLLLPVVNDPKQASATLNWAVQEMTRRYKKFAEMSVRDVKGYNEHVLEHPEEELQKMPQIVIIIDELADLMMVASKEVEASICRLAQMARAAGMHLVIATQRPSVDVITGLIKANIPSRIAFAVSSGIDSRTILDSVGAEKLLGKGDMLFAPIGASKPVRIQGTFVSDHEVENVVEFVRAHAGAPTYDTSIMNNATRAEGDESGISEEVDEFLEDAIKFVVDKQRASISMLQRAFRIGFNRAARLMDALEERGVVGEDQGSKPRMVLMTKEEWENENS